MTSPPDDLPSIGSLRASLLTPPDHASARAERLLDALRQHGETPCSAPLTHLQGKFLRELVEPALLDQPRDLILSGPTSSGKTTLAELLLLRNALYASDNACGIYLAPTRALAHAFFDRLRRHTAGTWLEPHIVVSTSDASADDWRIARGAFKIASVVYEKARLLLNARADAVQDIGLIVVDETHMLTDPHRGPGLEVFLTRVVKDRREGGCEARIACLTTEPTPDGPISRFLSRRDPDDLFGEGLVEPIAVVGHSRPVAMNHHVVIRSADLPYFRVVPVGSFPVGSDGRTLSDEERATFVEDVQNIGKANPDAGSPTIPEQATLLDDFVYDWLDTHVRGHQVLIVCSSIRQMNDFAGLCMRWRRDTGGKAEAVDNQWLEALSLMDNEKEAEDYRTLAASGIYCHFGQVPPTLRREIERRFAQLPGPNVPTRILLATDSLAYGVNLAVDTVILTDTRFWRQPRSGGNPKRTPIDVSLFHNLVGRAGRLGRMDPSRHLQADVYVPIETARSTDAALLGKLASGFARDYYSGSEPVVSALFDSDEDSGTDVGRMSSPWVTALLASIRHCGLTNRSGLATPREINAFLRHSLFALQRTTDDKVLNDIEASVNAAIAGLEQPVYGAIQNNNGRYRLSEVGEGILETGTPHTSIEPLRFLADSLARTVQSWGPEAKLLPELILLASLCQGPTVSRYLLGTQELDTFIPQKDVEAETNGRLAKMVGSHLGRRATLNIPPRKAARALHQTLQNFFSIAGDSSLTRKIHDTRLKWTTRLRGRTTESAGARMFAYRAASAMLRLWLALEAWCIGRSFEYHLRPILIPWPGDGARVPAIVPRWAAFCRNASWRSIFLARFVPTLEMPRVESGWFVARSASLTHGTPPALVPLVSGLDFSLSRQHAIQLVQAEWTPSRLAKESPQKIPGLLSATKAESLATHLRGRRLGSLQRLASFCLGRLDNESSRATRALWQYCMVVLWPRLYSGAQPESWPPPHDPTLHEELLAHANAVLDEVGLGRGRDLKVHAAWIPTLPDADAECLHTTPAAVALLGTILAQGLGGHSGATTDGWSGANGTLTVRSIHRHLAAQAHPCPHWLDVACRLHFDLDDSQ